MDKLREFYVEMIEMYNTWADDANREIEWLNKQIKIERANDKKCLEHIWSVGVLDSIEMRIWGDTKNYLSLSTKELIKQRQKQYYRKRKWKEEAEKYQCKLEHLK